ncbi:hypothetical protein F8M41_016968 [Gigaspora margarita]|uniref:Uncharacterized protein n=1 Tax=Gigaspora margarita TaxID=4874 RepID=A0A8H4B349_GIGMA|nr:hypothetical protein F8M41_016968 [Gigaspora margarita]
MCSGCYTKKKLSDFYYSLDDSPPSNYDTCQKCAKRSLRNRKAKKKAKSPNFQSSNSLSNFEKENIAKEPQNVVEYENFDSESNDSEEEDFRVFPYSLDKVNEVVAKKFKKAKISDKPASFAFEVELDNDFLAIFNLNQQDLANLTDLKIIKERFQQLAEVFIILLESGSGYYWEI